DHEVVFDIPVVHQPSLRVRKADTALSHAAFCSIIAQCPQLGNTCSSTSGIVRIGTIDMSIGVTRSSRPQVISVLARILCSIAHCGAVSAWAAAAAPAAMAALPYTPRMLSH